MHCIRMSRRNEKGFILVWITIVVLLLAIMGVGLLRLCAMEAVLVVNEVHRLSAFNLAEAGLERALWKFADDPPWTDGWQDQALGDGTYSVTVAEAPEVGGGWYRITSTGTAGDISKTVTLEFKAAGDWPAALDYGIFWANFNDSANDLVLRADSTISSDVFAYGDIVVGSGVSVTNGLIYATGTVTGAGQYTVGDPPGSLPEKVTLDTSSYDALIAQAALESPGAWVLQSSQTYNLNGATLFVKGKVEIEDDAQLYGPGKIVATGNIVVKNDAVVSGGPDLISGHDLDVQDDASYDGTGSVLFASHDLTVEGDASLQGNVVLLSPHDLTVKDSATVRGVLWSEHTAHLYENDNVHITGVIYAGEFQNAFGIGGDGDAPRDFSFVHDSTVLDVTPPAGVPAPATLTIGTWDEP